MMPVTEHFTIYHINAPGQEDAARPLPTVTIYPSMDQLAETVDDVFIHLKIKSAIGFGVGLGGNVLVRFALYYPSKINGLILINCISRGVRWLEGFSFKGAKKDIPEQRWTDSLMNYLIWYHLGYETASSQPDLVNTLRRHLEDDLNVKNIIKLLNSFMKRTAIPLERPNKNPNSPRSLKCTVINVTGSTSPHKDDAKETNDRCDPAMASYIEFPDCGGAVIDEQPARLAESIRLFLQGLGYMSHLSLPRYSTANRLAEQVADYKRHHGSFSKVPRRLSTHVGSGDYNPDYPVEFEEELHVRVDSRDNRKVNF